MFQTGSGIFVPFPQRLKEEYQVRSKNCITANVSFPHLAPLLEAFLHELKEPLFLAVHIPLNINREKELFGEEANGCHEEVFYLDGQSKEQITQLLGRYGELLLNDGLCQFAIGSHAVQEEIFVQKYQVVHLFGNRQDAFAALLESFGLVPTQQLETAWDTFTPESPGGSQSIRINGLDIYEMVEELKAIGLYSAKIIEE